MIVIGSEKRADGDTLAATSLVSWHFLPALGSPWFCPTGPGREDDPSFTLTGLVDSAQAGLVDSGSEWAGGL